MVRASGNLNSIDLSIAGIVVRVSGSLICIDLSKAGIVV